MRLRSFRSALQLVGLVLTITTVALSQAPPNRAADRDWPVYRGDPKGNQYAPLAQIHAANVHRSSPPGNTTPATRTSARRCTSNPIVVNGVMYITTPSLKAVALDAATGARSGSFDPAKYNNGNVDPAAQSRRHLLEGRRGRADLPLRPRPRLRGRREDGRADHHVRQRRVHRSAAEPRRRSGDGRDRDDLAGRGVQEPPDHRLARQRELRRVARPHPRLRHRHRRR